MKSPIVCLSIYCKDFSALPFFEQLNAKPSADPNCGYGSCPTITTLRLSYEHSLNALNTSLNGGVNLRPWLTAASRKTNTPSNDGLSIKGLSIESQPDSSESALICVLNLFMVDSILFILFCTFVNKCILI